MVVLRKRHLISEIKCCLRYNKLSCDLCCCCSVAKSCLTLCNSMDLIQVQYAKLPCPSPSPVVCPSSCPMNRWCHPTISSSVVPFSSHLQSFPASGAFLVSQLFTSGGQSIGASVSCMLSSQLGRNMFCIMFEWEPSVWEEIELYLQWTATLENRAVLCNWTCLSLVLI